MFLSKKHNFQLNLSKNSFKAYHILPFGAGIEALIVGEYEKLADMVIWSELPRAARLSTSYFLVHFGVALQHSENMLTNLRKY